MGLGFRVGSGLDLGLGGDESEETVAETGGAHADCATQVRKMPLTLHLLFIYIYICACVSIYLCVFVLKLFYSVGV